MFPKNSNSHLACECGRIAKLPFSPTVEDYCFCSVSRININEEIAGLVGRPTGSYSSIFCGKFSELGREAALEISKKTAEELGFICQKHLGGEKKPIILVVGLGNQAVTHDSLGARVCDKLYPTDNLFVFSVGVSGKSGMESAKIVKSLAECSGAELVIAVDSLAARGEERVGKVIQVSDSGIAPGSGAGKECEAINKNTVGVPIISVGVPTVLADENVSRDGYLLVGDDVLQLCENVAEILSHAVKLFARFGSKAE